MKRRHNMPFGAQCNQDGSVRFRLWAPNARQVALCLQQEEKPARISLNRADDGWFELVTDAAQPGSLYSFQIDNDRAVPDPASRFQPRDVHGPSEVIDPADFDWGDSNWNGRRWEEAVIYELHVGAFTAAGNFKAVGERLDYLADLGVTALELMPVADFPGKRNWGYDGVFPFAADSNYGRPEDLKQLVLSAHERGLMVLLDVVYNHFGPEGNYLNVCAPQFFTSRHHTPWGNAINFDGAESRTVRDFFIQNALYWLNEFRFDGLRLDAVHEIIDDSTPHILAEIAGAVRAAIEPTRQVHLILENDLNQSRYLQRESADQVQDAKHAPAKFYTAQWNDDFHHSLHTIITGEREGYYADYFAHPFEHLSRCLVSGFAYQGEASLFRDGKPRGEPTAGLPTGAFVTFLQNHDQTGNRAFGERIATLAELRSLRAAAAILLLAPFPPLLFMGEEFGTEVPFLFFCDFEKGLAEAVTAGRRNGFARFARFSDPSSRAGIPDPNDPRTFDSSRLDWNVMEKSKHREWLDFYRQLLKLRQQYIVPRISGECSLKANCENHGNHAFCMRWEMGHGSQLTLFANLGPEQVSGITLPSGQLIYKTNEAGNDLLRLGVLPAWSVMWFIEP
jgi:malto-oligosyltrehalose trehalohydrolase